MTLLISSRVPLPEPASVATTASYAIVGLFGFALFMFLALVVLRLIFTKREEISNEKKEHLRPLVYELLTDERSPTDVVATLKSTVRRKDWHILKQVLLENMRFLKGREREILSGAFDDMGFVDEDIRKLQKRGVVRRAESAFNLGTMRSARATPYIVDALTSDSDEVIFSCINALSKIGTPEAIEAVVEYLASATELKTLRVAEVILERKQEFSGYIEEWLEKGGPDKSRLLLLMDLAGAMKDTNAVPLLLGFLEDEDPAVRARAAFALGHIGDFTACGPVSDKMDDRSPLVRAQASEALGRLQCFDSIPVLKRGLLDVDLSVKMNSAVSLSQLGEEGNSVLEERLSAVEETDRVVAAEVLDLGEIRKGEE